jgi:two-component system sensor histidine kinase UhpB
MPSTRLLLRMLSALLCAAFMLCAVADEGAVRSFTQAQKLQLPAPTTAPPAAGAWQPVVLPDDWSSASGTVGAVAWYRLRFETPALPASGLLAAYVPRVCSTLEV